jgi:hypothetical protein
MATGGYSPGVTRQGRETDHSLPSCAEVKNGGAITPPPIRLPGVKLNYLSTGKTLRLPLLSPKNERFSDFMYFISDFLYTFKQVTNL